MIERLQTALRDYWREHQTRAQAIYLGLCERDALFAEVDGRRFIDTTTRPFRFEGVPLYVVDALQYFALR